MIESMAYAEYLRSLFMETRVKLQVVERTTVPLTWNYPDRVYDYNRLYFILDGNGWVKVGVRVIHPQAGDLVLLPAGVPVSYGTAGLPTYTKYWCHFTATVGDISLFRLVQVPTCIRVSSQALFVRLFDTLIEYSHADTPTAPLRVQSVMLDLISCFMEASLLGESNPDTIWPQPAVKGNGDNLVAKMQQVLVYMGEHLDSTVTVQHLAEQLHFHPNYFIKVFRSILGVSPMQYLNRLRLERAKQALITDNRSIVDIARTIGMDAHYLARKFRQYTGYSPTEFRALVMHPERDNNHDRRPTSSE